MSPRREILVGTVIIVAVLIAVFGTLWLQGTNFGRPSIEVQVLLAPHFELQLLSRQDVLADNGRFLAKGVERLEECCYRLVRR